MPRPYEPLIPNTVGEVIELLGWMMLNSPKFEDTSGYFPGQNIDTEFFALKEGLKANCNRLGEERCAVLLALSDRMRAHFQADPENKTDDTLAGRALILEMIELLKSGSRRKTPAVAAIRPKGS